MKQGIFKYCTGWVLVFVLAFSAALAHTHDEKRRTIKKSYKVSSKTEVHLSNSFGKVHINTWDKNQVDVAINIIVNASSESRAQDFLDRINIDIDDDDPESELSFSTSINGKNTGRNTSFEVNYDINMPKTNSLELKNSFGDVYVADLAGQIELDVQYGNLNAGRLTGNAEVRLAFGNGFSEIVELKMGELRLSYSKLAIERMGNAEVNSQFSTMKIESADKIELTGKYGEIEIGEIEELEADINFSGFELGMIGRILDLDIDYGGNIEINMSEKIRHVEIENSFGPLKLRVPAGLNADIELNLSFSDLKYDDSLVKFNKIEKDHTSSEYEGVIGRGGDAEITIKSKYGNVRIE